jgi:hypothetical protein
MAVRVTYGEATLAGQGVVTYAPSSPAAKEIELLTAAVLAAVRGTNEQAAPDREPGPQTTTAPKPAKDRRPRGGGPRTGDKRRAAPAGPVEPEPDQLALPALGAPDSNRAPGVSSTDAVDPAGTDPARTPAATGARARGASGKGSRRTRR